MCRLLIRALDQVRRLDKDGNPDPTQDPAQLHNAGDIIHILEDGMEWGRDEVKTPGQGGVHYTMDIPGVSGDEFRKYKIPSFDPFTLKQIAARAYKFDLADPEITKATLDGAKLGTVEIPKADTLYFIKNKIDDTREGPKPADIADAIVVALK